MDTMDSTPTSTSRFINKIHKVHKFQHILY